MDDQAPKKQPPSAETPGAGANGLAPSAKVSVPATTGAEAHDAAPTAHQAAGAAHDSVAQPPPRDDRPRLRPLDAFPVDNPNTADRGAPKLLTLRDPSGLAQGSVTLPPMGVAVIDLCDGTRTRDEIRGEFQQRYGSPLSREALDALLKRLDDALLLDSAAFRNHAASTFADFARSPVRPAHFAGTSYPKDPEALRQVLDGCFAPPNGPGLPAAHGHRQPDAPDAPVAIIAPHVDFTRGGPAYAWAYRPLLEARAMPDLIILLGTDHAAPDPSFTLLRKHFDTPLGPIQTDLALCDELLEAAKALSPKLPEQLLRDEHHHRGEHSLEFQAVWLRHVLSHRDDGAQPKILPILCGSFHEFVGGGKDRPATPQNGKSNGPALPFLALLCEHIDARRAAGQSILYLCAADLAHVGPRYGDRDPLSPSDCNSLEQRDRATLRPVCAGDADGWFRELYREKDRRRVCGLSPIYTMLKIKPEGPGTLRCYGQCQAEGGSIVSIASVIF